MRPGVSPALERKRRSRAKSRAPPRLSLECRPYQPLQSGTAMGLTGSRNEGSKSIARPSSVSPSVVLKQKEALFISRFIFCRRLPHINPPLLGVLCSAPLCHRRRSCLCLPSLKNEALDLASLHFCRRRPPSPSHHARRDPLLTTLRCSAAILLMPPTFSVWPSQRLTMAFR